MQRRVVLAADIGAAHFDEAAGGECMLATAGCDGAERCLRIEGAGCLAFALAVACLHQGAGDQGQIGAGRGRGERHFHAAFAAPSFFAVFVVLTMGDVDEVGRDQREVAALHLGTDGACGLVGGHVARIGRVGMLGDERCRGRLDERLFASMRAGDRLGGFVHGLHTIPALMGETDDEGLCCFEHELINAACHTAEGGPGEGPLAACFFRGLATEEDGMAGQREVEALGDDRPFLLPWLELPWICMGVIWPDDGLAVATEDAEEAVADGGGAVAEAANLARVEVVAETTDHFLFAHGACEHLDELGKVRVVGINAGGHAVHEGAPGAADVLGIWIPAGLAVFDHLHERSPGADFLHVLHGHDLGTGLGPAQHDEDEAPDSFFDGFAAFGLAEVSAVR